jgi:dCTP deaminase
MSEFFENLSSVLSDHDIISERSSGGIVIKPFSKANLGNCSYDVTLGPWFYRSNKSNNQLLLPWDQESVENYWGSPLYASSLNSEDSQKYKLPLSTKVILLEPGELILASTNEFIGGTKNITTMMKARSSMGRVGISVCKDAGWGDIGYINRWTLEISNFSSATVPLVVGSRIAQIVFFRTSTPVRDYHTIGSYQRTNNLDELEKFWHETSMLPKYRF